MVIAVAFWACSPRTPVTPMSDGGADAGTDGGSNPTVDPGAPVGGTCAQDDECAEHGRDYVSQLGEGVPQSVDERQGRILGEVLHVRNLRGPRFKGSEYLKSCFPRRRYRSLEFQVL